MSGAEKEAKENKEKPVDVPYLHSALLTTYLAYHLLAGILLGPDALVTFTTQLP